RHVDLFAVRADRDALGLLADFHGRHRVARRDVDHAQLRRVLVGDVEPRAVGADRELLGIVARVNDALHLAGLDVDLADAVGGPIGRRQRLLVAAGRRGRRTTARDGDGLPVGAELNAARALAESEGAEQVFT